MNEPLRICFCASEAVPFAKTGGLADVAGALPHALAEAGCDVRSLLAGLPADQRDVIVLHWIEGFSFAEVALVVGASLSAVKVRAHRGYVAIRKVLSESAIDAEAAPSSRG